MAPPQATATWLTGTSALPSFSPIGGSALPGPWVSYFYHSAAGRSQVFIREFGQTDQFIAGRRGLGFVGEKN